LSKTGKSGIKGLYNTTFKVRPQEGTRIGSSLIWDSRSPQRGTPYLDCLGPSQPGPRVGIIAVFSTPYHGKPEVKGGFGQTGRGAWGPKTQNGVKQDPARGKKTMEETHKAYLGV